MQRRVAVQLRSLVHSGASLDQLLRCRRVICPGCLRQRCPQCSFGINVRAGVNQQLQNRHVATIRRPHERAASSAQNEISVAHARLGVHVRAVFEEQPHGFPVAARRGGHQRGCSKPVGCFRVRPAGQDQVHGAVRVPGPCRQHQSGVAQCGTRLHVRALFQQQSGFLGIERRAHEGRCAGGVGGVHLGAALDQQAQRRKVSINGGVHQRRVARRVAGVRRSAVVQ